MKKFSLFLAITFILGCANLALAQQNNVSLPGNVQNILNQNFPKWKVVKNVCSTAISGDFNGDKKTDYIVVLTYQNGGSVSAVVSESNDFRLVVVDSLSKSEAEHRTVSTIKKGAEVSQDPFENRLPKTRLKNDGFYYGSCESDDGSPMIFKNGAFVSAFGDSGNNSGGSNNNSGSNYSSKPTTYKDSRGANTKYNLGDMSFADRVVSFKKGNPANNGKVGNPDFSLGKPDYKESRDDENYVTLGCAGVLTVEFVDNVLVDGNGNDLYIYEIGPDVEPTKVEISKDGKNWINVGSVRGSTASLDISRFVSPNDEFRFVRLTDLKSACSGGYPGADIDAIGAINSRRNDGGSSSNNNPPPVTNNNPPPQDVPYDPNNQISVKLYLFKLGKADNPNCNTGLEAVPMSITKRPLMLRATLEELFRYPEIQRGYSNFASKVSLKDIKIENGTALVYLNGTVSRGCSSTRFVSQITSTAKQYPTVKAVRIFLNDAEFTGQ